MIYVRDVLFNLIRSRGPGGVPVCERTLVADRGRRDEDRFRRPAVGTGILNDERKNDDQNEKTQF